MGADASKPEESVDVHVDDTVDRNRMIASMDEVVRNRLRGGVQYNMKIVICGARGTGKTSLWKRFQGASFPTSYNPTPEIQSSTINWTFKKNQEDHVKVEVWDVVDIALSKLKKTSGSGGNAVLKNVEEHDGSTTGQHVLELLDSSVVDIYKGTHAVIFLVNPLSVLSLVYVRNKYQEVPLDISILILLNFKDLKEGEAVDGNNNHHTASAQQPRVTMAQINTLCTEINAYRLQARSPVAPLNSGGAGGETASRVVAVEVTSRDASVVVGGVGAGGISDVGSGLETASLHSSNSGDDTSPKDDHHGAANGSPSVVTSPTAAAPTNELSKLSLQNLDNLSRTQQQVKYARESAARNNSMYMGNALLNDTVDSVHGFEASLMNCYGLGHVHKFLDLPFLKLKRQTLLDMIRKVECDLRESDAALRGTVRDSDYFAYEEGYKTRLRERELATAGAAGMEQPTVHSNVPAGQQQPQNVFITQQQQQPQHGAGASVVDSHNTGSTTTQQQQATIASVPSPLPSGTMYESVESSAVHYFDDDEGENGGGYIALKKTKLVKGKRRKGASDAGGSATATGAVAGTASIEAHPSSVINAHTVLTEQPVISSYVSAYAPVSESDISATAAANVNRNSSAQAVSSLSPPSTASAVAVAIPTLTSQPVTSKPLLLSHPESQQEEFSVNRKSQQPQQPHQPPQLSQVKVSAGRFRGSGGGIRQGFTDALDSAESSDNGSNEEDSKQAGSTGSRTYSTTSQIRKAKSKTTSTATTQSAVPPPETRMLSQFELEVEAFKPTLGSNSGDSFYGDNNNQQSNSNNNSNTRTNSGVCYNISTNTNRNSGYKQHIDDSLESFLEPSDDEERARIANKERVRSFLKPTKSTSVGASQDSADGVSYTQPRKISQPQQQFGSSDNDNEVVMSQPKHKASGGLRRPDKKYSGNGNNSTNTSNSASSKNDKQEELETTQFSQAPTTTSPVSQAPAQASAAASAVVRSSVKRSVSSAVSTPQIVSFDEPELPSMATSKATTGGGLRKPMRKVRVAVTADLVETEL